MDPGVEPIGFVTWDLRNRPEYVEIGHNGIREKYKRQDANKRERIEAEFNSFMHKAIG